MHLPIRLLLAPALTLLLVISPMTLADEAADRASLEAAAQAWVTAFNARDVDSLVELTTEDVVLLDPVIAPVSGREAARAALAQALSAATDRVTTTTKEIVIAGEVAWRIGAFAHTPAKAASLSPGGQSLEIWKRVNGEWKLHRQMSSTILGRPKLTTRPLPTRPFPNTHVN